MSCKLIATCRLTVFALLALAHLGAARVFGADKEPMVVFLVRHAEKLNASKDPDLSTDGKLRAQQLASFLRDAKIQFVHSSDYVRTRNTAQPIVKELHLTLKLYDPRDLPTLAKNLKGAGGRHLVVGHSNTTPAVVKLLGGSPGAAIHEASEYDRLYCLTIDTTGATTTVLMRYGAAPKAKSSD